MSLEDKFGRQYDYLRISVTDRCNLRCIYCMGPEGIKLLPHQDILTYEEIVRFVEILAPLGIKKLRITGGEPLVRKGIENLIGSLSNIPGIKDVALTTNGQLLAKNLEKLKEKGLNRLNISVDSLRPITYKKITRGGDLNNVLAGIKKALALNFSPIKLNVVLMAGINELEIADFLKLTLDYPLHVRFIEYMPLDNHDTFWLNRYLPLQVVKDRALALGYRLNSYKGLPGNGTAEIFQINKAKGTIGLIHPVSGHFCSTCNRLRLTADGKFKPCLYWDEEIYVREAIGNPQLLTGLIKEGLCKKKEKHLMAESNPDYRSQVNLRSMAQIGG